MKYGVQGISTLLFLHHGKRIELQMGAPPPQALKAKAEALLHAEKS
jgi:hypothetical protein